MEKRKSLPEVERNAVVDLACKSIQTEEGVDALKYLTDKRGISEEIISRFKVGYCPKRVKHALNNRIITPIYDPYGKLVALSSRHLIHTKNFFHESFDKGFYLYGLNIAKFQIVKRRKAIVVEGEFDAMFLHSHDLGMTVGMCGSAFNLFQLSLLSRYCSDIYVVFDGDNTRAQSIKRLVDMYKENSLGLHGINLFAPRLPMDNDPDDFIREHGRKDFIEILKDTKPIKE